MINRLQSLRRAFTQHNINAFFVPSEDAHLSEYIASADKRREWISNFSGSAGHALVTDREALLSTDGRYYLQANQELDSANYKLLKAGQPNVPSWYEYILEHYQPPFNIGLDPKLIAFSEVRKIQDKLKTKPGFELVAVENNPIDEIADLPPYPDNEVYVQPIEYAGRSVSEKLADIRAYLAEKHAHSFIVTMLDETAWLFNLRGSDIVYNPLFFSYAIVTQDSCTLYVNSARLNKEALEQVKNAGVVIEPYNSFYLSLQSLSQEAEREGKRIHISDKANWEVVRALREEHVEVVRSPVADAKAVKNEVELQGTRNAHARDGIALTQYFAWLEGTLHANNAPLKEHDAALKLEEYRAKLDNFKGLSFNTISATGGNGAIIHYSPSETDSAAIDVEKVYLCDSGAQFLDGTTDVTRTYFFGRQTPSDKLKRAFTRVLQGHIAIATTVIPNDKVYGPFLDAIARVPLWKEGLMYEHGTGHGIGSHLGAHEGPHSISPRFNDVTLKNGFLVSNEPGYYEEGEFGIRTEAILAIVPHKTPYNYNDAQFSSFETLTVCPIGTNMIDVELLTDAEKGWLNAYHKRCLDTLKPELEKRGDGRAVSWLEKNTVSAGRETLASHYLLHESLCFVIATLGVSILHADDEAVQDILDGTSYAVLYSFVEGVGWKKEMVEGSMFIFTRSVVPRYGLFILNRSGPDNFITLFTGTDDLQLTGDYIIFRPADEDAIWGVWVFDASHRPRIAKCIEDIEQLAAKEKDKAQVPAKVDAFVDPAIASISASPAQQPGSSNGMNAGQPLSVDDLFGNFGSPALSATNAAPAPSTLPTIDQQQFNVATLPPQQPQPVQQYEAVKETGTQELLSFLGLPPTATVENTKQSPFSPHAQVQVQQTPPHPHQVQHTPNSMQLPPMLPVGSVSGSVSPSTQPGPAPAPLSIPIDPMSGLPRLAQSQLHSQTPLLEPSVPPTPLPLSAVTPSEPRNPVILNDELESLKRLTFEEGVRKEQQSPAQAPAPAPASKPSPSNPQQTAQQFNKNFPPLGISPPTMPRAERERQQRMQQIQMQQQGSSGASDDDKASPGLFNPGIRTQVRTVPKARKPSAIGHVHRPSVVSPTSLIDGQQMGAHGGVNGAAPESVQVPQVAQMPPQLHQMQQLQQAQQAQQIRQAQQAQQVQQAQQAQQLPQLANAHAHTHAHQTPQLPQVPQVPQQFQASPAHQVPQPPAQHTPLTQHLQHLQHTPEVPRISPQVGLDVMTPTLSLLRHPSGQKLDKQGFKQALSSLIVVGDDYTNDAELTQVTGKRRISQHSLSALRYMLDEL
ncbi:hypothetical protein E3P99_01248 [Wallemia hederae]|uniref:Aminopeptidase P N-terminal domain-containing protein n=1 Tax=Wallemia hederae TaxID=1540922 RepID=A0A4T0FS31_9BASI|nr:hypothetical protein E3P99_01248 [Wallemia hederae]